MPDPRPQACGIRLAAPPGVDARLVTAARQDRPPGSTDAVVMTGRSGAASGTWVLYAPGRWQNGLLWQREDPGRDFRCALAVAGLPSVTVRYRTTGLQGPADHDALAACTTADLVADVEHAARFTARRFAPKAVVVAGYSLGAMLACLALPAVRDVLPVAGLVLLDGGFGAPGPPRPWPALLANPARDPRLEAFAASLPSGTASASHALRRLGTAVGDPDGLRFLLCADRWWPGRQIGELHEVLTTRSYRGRPLADPAAGAGLPVLAFAATRGVGRQGHRAAATAELLGGPRARTVWLDGWSHAHVMAHSRARQAVHPRLVAWMRQTAHGMDTRRRSPDALALI